MSEIKLFLTISTLVHEIPEKPEEHKRDIQALFEENLETFLGIRLICSKYKAPDIDGHIDTLGLDAQNNPTVIVFGRRQNIRGLSHRQWLEENRRAFEHEVSRQGNIKGRIVWSNPRVICVASGFSNDEIQAANQSKNFELIQYRRYGSELLWLDFLNESSSSNDSAKVDQVRVRWSQKRLAKDKSHAEHLEEMGSEQARRYEKLERFFQSLGSDIVQDRKKLTENFSRIKKKFASLQLMNQKEQIYVGLNLDPKWDVYGLEEGFARDMTGLGHWGIGNLRLVISSDADIERAKPLIQKAYDRA